MNKNTKSKRLKAIKVKPTGEYPCQWDDLIDSKNNVIATIYTLTEGKKDNLKSGITKGTDGVYDIVVNSKEITAEIVRNALADLEKVTDKQYIFYTSLFRHSALACPHGSGECGIQIHKIILCIP